MYNNNHVLSLYACCIPVKGHRRAIICDTQRGYYYLIPNALFELVTSFASHTLQDLQILFKDDYDTILDYISFIESNELGHLIPKEEVASFPPIKLDWLRPETVTNAIIDIGDHLLLSALVNICSELNAMACKGLQIRFFAEYSIEDILSVVNVFSESCIRHIDLLIKYSDKNTKEAIQSVFNETERLSFVNIYNSPASEVLDGEHEKNVIFYEKNDISSHLHCGIVHLNSFSTNLDMFTESQHHNSCLNRKISIDVAGNIKNCPSMSQSFGNIKDTTLQQALGHADFKKYWNISKDQIAVCQDCEFRYICTDCRAYLENPEDMRSKPLKCGYNPYTCQWEEWSTHPCKQEALDYYGMREVLPEFNLQADYLPGKAVV